MNSTWGRGLTGPAREEPLRFPVGYVKDGIQAVLCRGERSALTAAHEPKNQWPSMMNTSQGDSQKPRTETEKKILQIWTEVLHRSNFGIHDNFFDLGGHSLQATCVTSRIGAAFDVETELNTFFEVPTIAGLSSRVDASLRTGRSKKGALRPA